MKWWDDVGIPAKLGQVWSKNINSTAGEVRPAPALQSYSGACPAHMVREYKTDSQARDVSHWSQVVALLCSKISHSCGLNDLCDPLDIQCGSPAAIRGATQDRRNVLSHADKIRAAAIAEAVFSQIFAHLREQSPGFGWRKCRERLHQINLTMALMDSKPRVILETRCK